MFLVSYLDGVPVCGLPGCVMYAKRTIFDLLLPRLLADDPITAEDIARLGEGGLCLNCEVCHWPNCGFGTAETLSVKAFRLCQLPRRESFTKVKK